MEEVDFEILAKVITFNCVRNTFLEDLHAGITPSSKTGNYSDVKVVTPYGEIEWNNLSRISDEEMKKMMIEIVNKIYTLLLNFDLLSKFYRYPEHWDKAKENKELIKKIKQLLNEVPPI
jgi:hypothetical protein